MKLCGFDVGIEHPLFLIAGPCVVESETLQVDVAGQLKEITARLQIPFIFKSSYDKANRSSRSSFRGPGIEEGLRVLAELPAVPDFGFVVNRHLPAATVDALRDILLHLKDTPRGRAALESIKPGLTGFVLPEANEDALLRPVMTAQQLEDRP